MNVKGSDSNKWTYDTLLDLCLNNKQYFYTLHDPKSQKLYNGFVQLEEEIENLLPLLNDFRILAPTYDFKSVPANGYRSFICIVDKLSITSLGICRNVFSHRSSLFFQTLHYAKEVESCCQVYSALNACFQLLQFLRTAADPGHLFLNKVDAIAAIQKVIDKVNIKHFYGRHIAFQFGDATQPVIKTVAIMMTAFSEYYYNEKNVFFCAAMCTQFFANPDLRAERMAQISAYRTACVDFCKSFWNMSESDIFKKMNVFFQPTHFVNKMYEIPAEPLQYKFNDICIDIPAPTAHIGLKPLNVRLVSAVKRQGMVLENNNGPVVPPSDWFILHLHGGGFVSQTSESHLVYLKSWTLWTDSPILSVDYSLAPEAPYPRAIEEALHAYVWALNNLDILGTKAKRIVFAGDSAGGNLCLALTLKCIEMNLRKPDGIFTAYAPTVLQFYPSPSRFLGLLDPLLSFGFMMSCVKAYTHTGRKSANSTGIRNFEEPSTESISFEETDETEFRALENGKIESKRSITPPSFSDISPDFEQNSLTSGTTIDGQKNIEELSLPSKYRSVIKGFVSNLKVKYTSNGIEQNGTNHCNHCIPWNDVKLDQLVPDSEDDIYLSIVTATDQHFKKFPPTAILTVEMDPCLDDSIVLAKRLDRLHKKVHLDVLKDLAHGFLQVSLTNKVAFDGSVLCAQRIKELLTGTLSCNR